MDSTELTRIVVTIIYYILLIPLAVLSAFGIYIFIRYGKTQGLALITSALYIVIFLVLLFSSYNSLQTL